MDPITAVAAATGLAQAFGIDKLIGRWLGGERGAEVAGQVMDVAQALTGAQDPQDIVEALKADKELSKTLRLKMLEISEAESLREAQDRASARAMQVAALGQDDRFSKRFVYYFASAWSLFTMLYIALITLANIPEANQRYADTILGFMLGTLVATIINFFFGSSKSSQVKDTSITALVEAIKGKVGGSRG